ncbi:MAG: hypothetical protein ACI8Z1_000580 [Candidatus Azotimanducaceae bacterium]|jgi:hypothetical protein
MKQQQQKTRTISRSNVCSAKKPERNRPIFFSFHPPIGANNLIDVTPAKDEIGSSRTWTLVDANGSTVESSRGAFDFLSGRRHLDLMGLTITREFLTTSSLTG